MYFLPHGQLITTASNAITNVSSVRAARTRRTFHSFDRIDIYMYVPCEHGEAQRRMEEQPRKKREEEAKRRKGFHATVADLRRQEE